MILGSLAERTARRMKTRLTRTCPRSHVVGSVQQPVRVVAFNTAEGWARDVSEDIAWEVLKRTAAEGRRLPESTRQFTQFHIGEKETLLAENAEL
jgi:hypothetical protein